MSDEWGLPEDEWELPERGYWRAAELTFGERFPRLTLVGDMPLDHPDLGIHLSTSQPSSVDPGLAHVAATCSSVCSHHVRFSR